MTDLPDPLVRRLRAAVLAHKQATPRGHVAPRLHAGTPGAGDLRGDGSDPVSFTPGREDRLDHDTRIEVAVALGHRALRTTATPMLWLTRSGDADFSCTDLSWLAAGAAAWGEIGLAPSFAVLTRQGWRHHPSGAYRTWRRLRAPAS